MPKLELPMWAAHVYAPFKTAWDLLAKIPPRITNVSLQDLSDHPNVSYARAEQELGYQPRPFRDTLADTLRWFAANSRLQLALSNGTRNGGS